MSKFKGEITELQPFWREQAPGRYLPLNVTRIELLLYAASTTETGNPSWPGWSIGSWFFDPGNLKGLWDGDPGRLVRRVHEMDPEFWGGWGSSFDLTRRKAEIGQAMRCLVNGGQPRHGKPNFGRNSVEVHSNQQPAIAGVY